jgi:hypothetical protein
VEIVEWIHPLLFLMVRHIFIFTLSFFVIQCSHSQSISDKNTLSIWVGPSFPLGNFSSTDPSNYSSGYANPGGSAILSFEHKVKKELGLVVMIYGERNGLNTSALAAQFENTGFFAGYVPGPPRYYPNWTIDKNSWYLESVLAGVSEEIPLEKNNDISFIAKGLIGIAYGQSPRLNAKSRSDTSYTTITQNGASAFGFSYLLMAGVKCRLNSKIQLLVTVDYFGTTPLEFENLTESIITTNGGLTIPKLYSFSNSVDPIIAVSSTGSSKQPVGSINVHVGLGLTL